MPLHRLLPAQADKPSKKEKKEKKRKREAEEAAAAEAPAAAAAEAPAAEAADGEAKSGKKEKKKKEKKEKKKGKEAAAEAAAEEEPAAAAPPAKKRKTDAIADQQAAAAAADEAAQQAAEPQAGGEEQEADAKRGGRSDGGYNSSGKEGTAAKAFQRVKADEWLDKKGAWDNSYVGTFGQNGWGWKAQEVLGKVGAGCADLEGKGAGLGSVVRSSCALPGARPCRRGKEAADRLKRALRQHNGWRQQSAACLLSSLHPPHVPPPAPVAPPPTSCSPTHWRCAGAGQGLPAREDQEEAGQLQGWRDRPARALLLQV